jgi:O-antigen/teichoic acid export membrane protein
MNREFLINILFLVGINLLIKPLYIFGIDRTVQNVLPPASYGIYFVLLNFTFLFQIFNDFGIAYFNSRNLSRHPRLISKYFPNLLMLKILLSVLFFFVMLLAAWIWGYWPQFQHLLWMIGLNQVLTSMLLFLRSNLAGLGLYRWDSVFSALDRLLLILICGFMLYSPGFSSDFRIEYFVWAQTAALTITALTTFIILTRYTRLPIFGLMGWNPAFVLLFFKKSFPYAVAVFLMTIYTRVDAIMIERLLPDGAAEAGIYAAAYRLLDAAAIIGFLFAGLLLPMFARMLHQGDDVGALAHFSFKLLFVFALPMAIVSWYWGDEIMRLLYLQANAYYGHVLGTLMWSFVASSGIYIYGTLLTAGDQLKRMNMVFLSGLVINVILNMILIPPYKAQGAALATSITQTGVWLGEMWLLKQHLQVFPDKKMMLQLLLFSFLSLAIIAFSHALLPFHWLIMLLADAVLIVLTARLLHIIDFRQLARLLIFRR